MIDLIKQHHGELFAVCRKYDVKRLDLFGSAARNDFDATSSDLDFLVDFNNWVVEGSADRYFGLLEDLSAIFNRRVDLVCDSAIANPYFRKSVDAERINVYAVRSEKAAV